MHDRQHRRFAALHTKQYNYYYYYYYYYNHLVVVLTSHGRQTSTQRLCMFHAINNKQRSRQHITVTNKTSCVIIAK